MAEPGYLHGPMAEAAGRLRLRLDEAKRAHRGETGRVRELAVISELLTDFLPRKLAVASGEVVATNGSTSAQHDILIFDEMETPRFDNSNGSVVVPVEGVYAVIEVSSQLDGAKLKADAAKIQRLKQMPKASDAYYRSNSVIEKSFGVYGQPKPHFPIMGFCFGYRSAALDTLQRELVALDKNSSIEQRVDMICSLEHGCIANGVPVVDAAVRPDFAELKGWPSPDNQRFSVPADAAEQPGAALMLFYLLGLGTVVQAHTDPLRLVPYMEQA